MTARGLVAWGLGAAMLAVSGDGRGQEERSTIAPLPELEAWDGLGAGEPLAAGEEGDGGAPAEEPALEAGGVGTQIGNDGSEEPAAATRSGTEALLDGSAGAAGMEIEVPDGAREGEADPPAARRDSAGARPAFSRLGDGREVLPGDVADPPAAEESVPVTSAGAGRQGTAPVLPVPAPSPPVPEVHEARGSLWRLLDARAERAAGATAAAFVADMAREGCPRDLLGRLLAAAADERGALSALALEREILVLCRKRQDAVAAVLTQEAALRGMVAGGVSAAAPAVAVSAPADWAAAIEVVPQLGLAGDAGDAGETPAEAEAVAERPQEAREAPAAQESAREPAPPYRWFTLTGSGGDLRAGVTDGTGVWFVRSGDALPGELWVSEISAAPPAVRVAGASAGALPWGAPP